MLESVVMRPRQLINLDTIIQKSLLFYRSKKPQPTNRCVINGVSCSQRFEKTFNQKMADEKTAVKALSNALDETAHKCAEINNVKFSKALGTLLFGTMAALAFANGSPSMCDSICPTEIAEDYGCAHNICNPDC